MWHAPARTAPAVVLVHMLTRSHAEWDLAAQALNVSGFGVLALDLRGHGASAGSSSALGPMQQDVQAGLDWLKARPDVVANRLGIAGASLGAALAPLVAAIDPAVRSIALLSPSGEYRGLRCEASMRKFAERAGAVMLVASTGDPYALRTAHHFEPWAPDRATCGSSTAPTPTARRCSPSARTWSPAWWTGFEGRCYDRRSGLT